MPGDRGRRYPAGVIVVIGSPVARTAADRIEAGGIAAAVGRAVAAAGSEVQLIGKVGDDPAGDAVLADLARNGVGHAAVSRDPAHATPLGPVSPTAAAAGDGEDRDLAGTLALGEEPEGPPVVGADGPVTGAPTPVTGLVLEAADIELALRYLVEYRAVVVADLLDATAARIVADAAAWTAAHVVVLAPEGSLVPAALETATVLGAPADDPDAAFAALVGAFAAALDRGESPGAAFRAATSAGGWEPAEA